MEAVNHYSETDLGNVSPNPRGEYDPKEPYEYLDLVSYQGGSYVCLAELETTITGTAPKPGKNTEFWQLLTLPGNLTAEAVAMHDDVVNKAAQVEISRAAVEQAQQEVEASQSDVQQLHEDTVQAAQEAENSRDSAAGYAQSAEASRKAAAESEQNINAQMTGLDKKVSESVTQAQEEIATARQQAIDAITTQETKSTAEVKRVGDATLESAGQALQKINTAGQQAVRAITDQQNTSTQAVKDETNSYIEEKKQEISDKTDEVTQAVNQAGKKQLEDIANSLDSTLTESGKVADAKAVGDALNNKITKFYASNQGETHLADSDNGKIMDMMLYGISSQDGTPTPDNPVEIKSVVNPKVEVLNENGTESQIVTIPYTLNAIPVSSGGNVTIGEQQYISDYVNVEKGKLYRKVKRLNLKDVDNTRIAHDFHSNGNGYLSISAENIKKGPQPISNRYKGSMWTDKSGYTYIPSSSIIFVDDRFTDRQTAIKLIQDTYVIYALSSQTEEDLSLEQIKFLKSLSTYYQTTNIRVNSEQLGGYIVFNYPISMANGWNYVKKQLNDNRDYIYNMDAKTQDIDTQAAEAYVNSEYAVALTELEAM